MPVRRTLFAAAAVLAAGFLHADDAPALKIDGFVDAYFKYNPNGLQATGSSVHVFDTQQNMFRVGGGRLGAHTDNGGIDIYLGDYATVLQPSAAAASEFPASLGQAYVTQNFGPLGVTLGLYMTHVGYEVADSVLNYNYTRSVLYSQVPFYHTGLKLNYSPLEGLGLMVQLDDGNSLIGKSDEGGGAGAQVSWTGTKGLALYLNYYYETVNQGIIFDKKHTFDVVASYGIMDGLDVAAEYLYFTTIASADTDASGDVITPSSMTDPETGKDVAFSPKAQGYALYLNYALPVEGLAVTPRFEAAYAPDSFISFFDYTLTLRYTKGSVINWLEWRTDVSTQPIFSAAAGETEVPYMEHSLTWATGLSF